MISFPKISLFYKFALIMISLATIPLAIASYNTLKISEKGMQGAILELHTSMVTSLAGRINSYIAQKDSQIQFIIQNVSTQERAAIYQSFIDSNPDYISISIVNDKGHEGIKVYNVDFFAKEPVLLDLSNDSTLKDFLKNLKKSKDRVKSAISSVYFVDNEPRLNIVYPIKIRAGYSLFIALSLTDLWNEVNKMRSGETGYTFLVDGKGSVIAHPKQELALNNMDLSDIPIVQSVLSANSIGSSEYINKAGEPIVGAYAPITSLKWGVITEQNKREAYKSVYQMRNLTAIFTAGIIVLASFIAFFFARRLTRPIFSLIAGAKKVAESDFSAKVEVGTTRDEMMDLAETFNLMTGKLKEYSDMQVDKIIAEKTKTEAIIFSIDDGLIMTDHEGKIQLINSQAKNIFDISNEESGSLQEKLITEIISNEKIKADVDAVLKNPHKDFFKEITFTRDYINQYFKANASTVKSLKGDDLGVVTVFHDITLEKELDQMKDDFLQSITHDLRNPMTSIRGFVKFLIDGVGGSINDQQKKMLLTVDRASSRLLGMINDILDIAKIESKKFEMDITEVDLKELAMHAQEINKPQIEKKNIEFALDFKENYSKVNVDSKLIDRVIQNLIGNSLKFTTETNGKVTIKLEETEKNATISIIDNGAGIPKEYLGKIFDKYQQVRGQRKGGTGLGLTICKFIVEAHKGRIWVESEVGKGSSFIFEIPKGLYKNEKGQVVIA